MFGGKQMNYEAGIITFLVYFVPLFLIYLDVKRDNERSEREYQRRKKDVQYR
jgi:hypothetical protein